MRTDASIIELMVRQARYFAYGAAFFLIVATTVRIPTASAQARSSELLALDAAHSPAANAATVRAQVDRMNHGDWRGALEFYNAESKNFGRPAPRALMEKLFEDIYATFPDFHMTIVELVMKDDWVIVRAKASGTHQGVGKIPLNGGLLVSVPATHKRFEVDVMHWYQLRDGKIVDHYDTRDDLGMMQQLGLLPEPAPFDWSKLVADGQSR